MRCRTLTKIYVDICACQKIPHLGHKARHVFCRRSLGGEIAGSSHVFYCPFVIEDGKNGSQVPGPARILARMHSLCFGT